MKKILKIENINFDKILLGWMKAVLKDNHEGYIM